MSRNRDDRRRPDPKKKKGNYRKPVEKPDKDQEYVESKTNDPAWYAMSPELLRDSASIPFSNAAGVPYSLQVSANTDTATVNDVKITVPGVLSFDVIPCPHCEPYANDPLNVAANSMLAFVVHANSRNLSYGASDLMIYNIAMGNVYSYINFLMRVYGTAQIFSTFNRNLPNVLAAAQYADYTDVINNLADFRYGINVLINKAASFAAPADMPYFRRLAFLFSGLYSEGESIKDQLYLYTPAGFMQYEETTETTGGSLKYKPYNNATTHTVKQLIDYGNELLNAIIGSEDMNVISGDILKAYGSDQLLKLATMPEIYSVLPVTDLAVLEQMQNATILGINANNMTVSITQSSRNTNTFALQGGVHLTIDGSIRQAITNKFILNTILTDPGPGDVMERTRMMCGVQDYGENEAAVFYATEVVQIAQMWTASGNTPSGEWIPAYNMIRQTPVLNDVVAMIRTHCKMEVFKFHPKTFYLQQNDAKTYTFLNYAMDVDNYTVFDFDTLDRMNQAAVMSLFHTHTINIVR